MITGILLDSRHSPRSFSTFYARRSLRIFPLYFLFVGFILLVASRFDGHQISGKWWCLTYLQNWIPTLSKANPVLGHLWSLAVEEQFYLTWPFFVWITPRKRIPALCIVFALSSVVARYLFTRIGLDELIYESTVTRMDGLVLGALAAFAFRDPTWRSWLARWELKIMMISLLCVLGTFASAGNMDYSKAIIDFGALPLAIFLSTAVFYVAAHPTFKYLNKPWLRATGKRAYAMYMIHAPLSALLTYRLQSTMKRFPTWERLLIGICAGSCFRPLDRIPD